MCRITGQLMGAVGCWKNTSRRKEECHIPKEEPSRARRIAREIIELLKKIHKPLEIEVGVEFEPVPAPVVKLYAKIRELRLLREDVKNENENRCRREDNNRSSKYDESPC